MNSALIRVALVIPVHNRRETTIRALRSLRRITRTGLEVRIFIVDDGSTDGTYEAIVSDFPDVAVIRGDGTLHYAAGTNRGIEAAMAYGAEYIVTMNDDSVFHTDFLIHLVESAQKLERSVVGALLLLWSDPHVVFQVDPKWRPLAGGWKFPKGLTAFSTGSAPFEVDCLVGNCVLIPSEAIKECGMLDEKNFRYGWGDAQFATRLRKRGWRLFVDPRSRVWCEPNTYPPPLHSISLKERLHVLLVDKRHPTNLKRQLTALWHSAPSKFSAVVAFASFLADLALKAVRIRKFAVKSQ